MKLSGKLTKKKLIDWCNHKFTELENKDFEVYAIDNTRYTEREYESGAAFLNVRFRHKKDHSIDDFFLCFYRIKDYQEYLNNGYSLIFKFQNERGRMNLIQDLTIDVIKSKQ